MIDLAEPSPKSMTPYIDSPSMPPQDANSIARMLWRRRGLLTFFALLGLAGGFGYFLWKPETYRSGALIEVINHRPLSNSENALENVADLAPGLAFIEAEMTSDAVLQDAVEQGQIQRFDGTPDDAAEVVGYIRENIEFIPQADNGEAIDRSMVQVEVTSEDAAAATAIVRSLVDAYSRYVDRRHGSTLKEVVGYFNDGRDKILKKIQVAEKNYEEFRQRTPLAWTPDGQAINPYREEALKKQEMINDLDLQAHELATKLRLLISAAKTNRTATKAFDQVRYILDEVSDLRTMEEIVAAEPETNLAIESRLIELRVQSQLFRDEYAASHPLRKTVDEELRQSEAEYRRLKSQMREEIIDKREASELKEQAARDIINGCVAGMRKKGQLLVSQRKTLVEQLRGIRDRAKTLMAFEMQNASQLREIERLQAEMESFDSQVDLADLPTMNDGQEIHVLRPASVADLVSPLLPFSLAGGAMLGLICGGGLAYLIELGERTFRGPDEIAETLGLPILAHIPLMIFPTLRPPRKRKGRGAEIPAEASPHALIDSSLTVLHDPHSAGSEAIRSIRTALFAGGTWEPEYQVVQVTSAVPGEGKSMVASNLAASIARTNRTVVMVDADLRQPTQDRLLGVHPVRGLTCVMNGDCTLRDAVVRTGVEGVSLLSSGPKPDNPAEALMLPDFGQLIEDLRSDFDVVLVDTPPMLAVTDASNVANHTDGVLLVTRIGRNSKPFAKRAVKMLGSLHTNVIGLVVNAIGDSSYSATYSTAWSDHFGGRPGSEFGYGHSTYGGRRYLDAPNGQRTTVRGRVPAATTTAVNTTST